MKIAFLGSPEFAIPSLSEIINYGYTVEAIITQTDKAKGRNMKVSACPVAKYAEENKLPLYKPSKNQLAELLTKLKYDKKIDLFVVIAYGYIIAEHIVNNQDFLFINAHASLLPKYRGASPIHEALIKNDKISGVTIIKINSEMDSGDILLQEHAFINEDNFQQLHDKLSLIAASLTIRAIVAIENCRIKYQKQNHQKASYCKKITKQQSKINWNNNTQNILGKIKAFSPKPGAECTIIHNDKQYPIKIIKANLITNPNNLAVIHLTKPKLNQPNGSVIACKPLIVKCENGFIEIKQIKPLNRSVMSDADFVNGYLK